MKSCWLAAAILCSSGVSFAAPGALDTTLDGTGAVVTAAALGFQNFGKAVAVQPDGKLVVAGYREIIGGDRELVLFRYNSDGTLDTTFDGDGKVIPPIWNSSDYVSAVALQPDGKIVVAGYSFNGAKKDFALLRYNGDGSLDATFDGDGKVTTPIGVSDDVGNALALQPDGKIVVAGISFNGVDNDVALARYNSDGSLDTTFDGDGTLTTPIGAFEDCVYAVNIQPDRKIVVAGYSFNGAKNDFALVRYNSDGSLDTTFDGDGMVTTSIGAVDDFGYALALQPDGMIVVAGQSRDASTGNELFALVRYNSDGTLDTTFDGDGKVTTAIGSEDRGRALAIQPDGKIVVGGHAYINYYSFDFALVRYNSDGSLDTTFAGGGKVTTALSYVFDEVNALAILPDGKIVAAGSTNFPGGLNSALVRYIATDTAWDLVPTAFGFTDQSDVALGSTLTSDVITVSGLDTGVKVPLQISGGSYSLNGGAFTTDVGWVQNGDTLVVRHVSSRNSLTATNTTLTFGGLVAANNATVMLGGTVSDVFTSTTGDAIPDAFAFTDQIDVDVNVTITAAEVSITGINIAAPVSVTGGEYSVGCTGVFTSTEGTVSNGDTVCVRHTAASTYSGAVNTTLTIGGISDIFTSTTIGDAVPDPFSFTDITAQALNSTVVSDVITVAGTAVASDISVTGGEYSIGCTSSFTAASGTISNGETVCVRHTTASSYSTTVDTTLTIGGVSDIFSSTTEVAPTSSADNGTSSSTASNTKSGGGAFDPLMALGALAAFGLRRRRAKAE